MYYYESRTFMQLVFESLFTPYGTGYVYKNVDWEEQFYLAQDSKLVSLLYPTILRLSKEEPIPSSLVTQWETQAQEFMELSSARQEAFLHFLELTEQENLHFILFKGAVLAELYPDPLYRISNDTDIFVDVEEGRKLQCLLERNGYEKDLFCSKPEVPVYVHNENGHRVEVHYSLFEEHSGPKIQQLERYDLTRPDHCIETTILGHTVTTLGPEEHLLYQIFHLIKHIIVEGTHFRNLLDIFLFTKANITKINIASLWEKLDHLGYGKFTDLLFDCCIETLYMEPTIMTDRIQTTDNERLHLWEELAKHAFEPLREDQFGPVCELFEPYVDGSDATEDPEVYLKENLAAFEPSFQRIRARLAALHSMKLTSREFVSEPLPPVHPSLFLSEEELTAGKEQAPYLYRAYGLTIASEIEMYELFDYDCPVEQRKDIDVYVHWSPAPESLEHPKIKKPHPDCFWFHSYNGRFLCRNGNEVIVEKKDANTPDSEIKAFIISHCLVDILYMRGRISIHSSTVGNEDGAITIMGDCGSGKSTYSTLLRHNGYKLIADDVSSVFLEEGKPYIEISVPQQKYTEDTAQYEGHKLEDLECVERSRGKYRLLLDDHQMCDGPRPMCGLFELIPDTKDNRLEFQKLEGMEAMRVITTNLFCQHMADSLGGLSVEGFEKILSIAQQVPVYRILRPTNRDARKEILQFILATAGNQEASENPKMHK